MNGVMRFLDRNGAWNGVGMIPGVGTAAGILEWTVSTIACCALKKPDTIASKQEHITDPMNRDHRAYADANALLRSFTETPPSAFPDTKESSYALIYGANFARYLMVNLFKDKYQQAEDGHYESRVNGSIPLVEFQKAVEVMNQGTEYNLNESREKGNISQNEYDAEKQFTKSFLGKVNEYAKSSDSITIEHVDEILAALYDQVIFLERERICHEHIGSALARITWAGNFVVAIRGCMKNPYASWKAADFWNSQK